MICSHCSAEMVKRWHPLTAANAGYGSAIVWACGVCGLELPRSARKLSRKEPHKSPLVLMPVPAIDHYNTQVDLNSDGRTGSYTWKLLCKMEACSS